MIRQKNTIYQLAILVFFICAKLTYSHANNNTISFLTRPTNAIISFITNKTYTYSPEAGFYYTSLNIVIDKSCSGFNFWMLLFLLLFFSTLKLTKTHKNKLQLFPATLLISYLLTLFVNTSRILVSLFIAQNTSLHYSWLHQAEGVFIYLSFLIVFYLSLNYLQIKFINNHEKLT